MSSRFLGAAEALPHVNQQSTAGRWDSFTSLPGLVTNYYRQLSKDIEQLATDGAVLAAIDLIWTTVGAGHDVYVVGNGGSASTAMHLAADMALALEGCCELNGRCGGVYSLADSSALISAIANDFGFDEMFSRQVATRGRAGDVLLALTVSGQSPNIVLSCRAARDRQMEVVALLGQPGEVAPLASIPVVVADPSYGRVEDTHLSFGHLLATYVRQQHPQKHRSTPAGGSV